MRPSITLPLRDTRAPDLTVHTSSVQSWQVGSPLQDGDSLTIQVESRSIHIRRDDRTGSIIVSGPHRDLERGTLRVRLADTQLKCSESTVVTNADLTRRTYRYPNMAGNTVQIDWDGSVLTPVASLRLSGFQVPSESTTSTASGSVVGVTRISWPAGPMDLTDALKRLTAHHRLSIGLGVDEHRAVEMSAFSGTWWEAVSTLCQRHALDVHIGDHAGSAVTLTASDRKAIAPLITAGAFLVRVHDLRRSTAHTITGIEPRATIVLRLIPEPRTDVLRFFKPTFIPDPVGEADGRPCRIALADQAGARDQNARFRPAVMLRNGLAADDAEPDIPPPPDAITLTAASDVLFAESGWTPKDMDQAIDHIHANGSGQVLSRG